ncbi:hypothetical protein EJB05_41410, partial [Eragrostis curvula]
MAAAAAITNGTAAATLHAANGSTADNHAANGATADNHAANGASNGAHDQSGRNHIVIFPFMAKGHMLPLFHFATALSAHHSRLRVTVVTTPGNAAFARSRVPASVDLVALPFPSLPPLPAGVESTDAVPCQSLHLTFLHATALLRAPFAEYLESLPSRPLALVSDFFLGFTRAVAAGAGVRRVVFNGMSCFSSAICKALSASPPVDHAGALFHVLGMPEHVEVAAEELPYGGRPDNPVTRFFVDVIGDSDVRSWGVLVNSFAALDEDYVPALESFYEPGARAWLVGPMFLAAGEPDGEQEPEQDPEGCLSLARRESFPTGVRDLRLVRHAGAHHGRAARRDPARAGAVGHPFLWAVRSDTWSPPVDAAGLDGLIVRGWVPQRSVLAHPSVGGFVSHCGWNSVMESLAAGKPVLAWPMIAEQHLNARHVANVLGVGVRMNVKENMENVVGRGEVEEKVRELMDADGKEGKRMRERAAWAQQVARLYNGKSYGSDWIGPTAFRP